MSAACAAGAPVAQRQEPYCPSATESVQAYYERVNTKGTRDLAALASNSEAAAAALSSCAHKGAAGTSLENDRLRIRSADALFIAAEARFILGQKDARMADLRALLDIVSRTDSRARTQSNERVYQEARLLLKFTRSFIAGARA